MLKNKSVLMYSFANDVENHRIDSGHRPQIARFLKYERSDPHISLSFTSTRAR